MPPGDDYELDVQTGQEQERMPRKHRDLMMTPFYSLREAATRQGSSRPAFQAAAHVFRRGRHSR